MFVNLKDRISIIRTRLLQECVACALIAKLHLFSVGCDALAIPGNDQLCLKRKHLWHE